MVIFDDHILLGKLRVNSLWIVSNVHSLSYSTFWFLEKCFSEVPGLWAIDSFHSIVRNLERKDWQRKLEK